MLGELAIAPSAGPRDPASMVKAQLDRLCTTSFITTHRSRYGGHRMDLADRWLEKKNGGLVVELSCTR